MFHLRSIQCTVTAVPGAVLPARSVVTACTATELACDRNLRLGREPQADRRREPVDSPRARHRSIAGVPHLQLHFQGLRGLHLVEIDPGLEVAFAELVQSALLGGDERPRRLFGVGIVEAVATEDLGRGLVLGLGPGERLLAPDHERGPGTRDRRVIEGAGPPVNGQAIAAHEPPLAAGRVTARERELELERCRAIGLQSEAHLAAQIQLRPRAGGLDPAPVVAERRIGRQGEVGGDGAEIVEGQPSIEQLVAARIADDEPHRIEARRPEALAPAAAHDPLHVHLIARPIELAIAEQEHIRAVGAAREVALAC